MSYNPIDGQLKDAKARLKAMVRQAQVLDEDLEWCAAFDSVKTTKSLTAAKRDIDRLTSLQTSGSSDLAELRGQTRALKKAAEENWLNPMTWFSNTKPVEKTQLKEHLSRIKVREDELKIVERDLEKAQRVAQADEASLRKHAEIDPVEARQRLSELQNAAADAKAVVQSLTARKKEVDRRLAAPLAELARREKECDEARQAMDRLERSLDKLTREIARADDYNRRISSAAQPRDRAILHRECEQVLGNSSPGAILRELRPKQRASRGDLNAARSRVSAAERDIDKLRDRIEKEARRSARDIKAIIIDGSNLCYDKRAFIGVAALKPLIHQLELSYNVTVVFDASIRRKLGVQRDDALAVEVGGSATVHVVASRQKADETILSAADSATTYVLSNDRFADFAEMQAVTEDRIIRHEIINGRIFVHDLDLDLRYQPE